MMKCDVKVQGGTVRSSVSMTARVPANLCTLITENGDGYTNPGPRDIEAFQKGCTWRGITEILCYYKAMSLFVHVRRDTCRLKFHCASVVPQECVSCNKLFFPPPSCATHSR